MTSLRKLWTQAVAVLGLEDVERAVTALLTRMLTKHERGEDDKIPYDEKCSRIIADLNLRLKHAGLPGRFKPATSNTRKLIKQRFDKDGFALADFYRVNQVMVHKWWNNEKMRDWLRPATLYNGEKFEGYLQSFYAWQAEKENNERKAAHATAPLSKQEEKVEFDPEFQDEMKENIARLQRKAGKPLTERQRKREAQQSDLNSRINEQ